MYFGIKPKQLELFLFIDRFGSINKAAEAIFMTQPAATRALSNLEAELGVKLFNRSSEGMTLTNDGRLFKKHAQIIRNQLEKCQEEIKGENLTLSGKINLGLQPVASVSPIIYNAVSRFLEKNPEVKMDVTYGSIKFFLDHVHTGELDLAIGRIGEAAPNPELHVEKLYTDRLCVTCRKGHPLTQKADLKFADLMDYPWVLPPPKAAYFHEVEACFHEYGYAPPEAQLRSCNPLFEQSLMQTTDCLTFKSVVMANNSKDVTDVLGVNFQRSADMGLILRKGALKYKVNQAFISMLKDLSEQALSC